MQNSLILQSRDLIEKLTHKKIKKLEVSNLGGHSVSTELFDKLLVDKNNLRQSSVAGTTHKISESIPKSAVASILSRSAYLSKSMPKRIPFGISNSVRQMRTQSNKCSNINSLDLLGYDWIAGMMENKAKETHLDQPHEYFEELEKFRRQNKQHCMSTENRHQANSPFSYKSNYQKSSNDYNYQLPCDNSEIPERTEYEPRANVVYAYTLNERLFPIPLDMETAQRGEPDINNPHIIKVSIPSNRFVHRNQKIQTMKEKTVSHDLHSNQQLMGESLSLSSHCQFPRAASVPTTFYQKTGMTNIKSSQQEPASLRGHILMESAYLGDSLCDSLSPFGGNQPRSQQEAVDQLQMGKTGAKLSRMVPSALTKRSLEVADPVEPMNICQTRITLRDMDDSRPRAPIKIHANSVDMDREVADLEPDLGGGTEVPRASLSRVQMSKVYGDQMRAVFENADSRL